MSKLNTIKKLVKIQCDKKKRIDNMYVCMLPIKHIDYIEVRLNDSKSYIQFFLFFDRLLCRSLSSASLTYYVTTFQDRKNKFVRSFFGRIYGLTILFRDLLTFCKVSQISGFQKFLHMNSNMRISICHS